MASGGEEQNVQADQNFRGLLSSFFPHEFRPFFKRAWVTSEMSIFKAAFDFKVLFEGKAIWKDLILKSVE